MENMENILMARHGDQVIGIGTGAIKLKSF